MQKVTYEKTGPVGTITLDYPEKFNVIDNDMLSQVIAAFRSSADNEDICVVYRARGDHFTFGADLKYGYEIMQDPARASEAAAYLWNFQELTKAMTAHPGILIAGYQGYVVGGGFEHTLGCDLRLAADDTVILMPELDAGLFFSNGTTVLLERLVGLGRARQLMLLGEEVPATAALEMGLVNHLCSKDSLFDQLDAWAEKIASKDHGALQLFKRVTHAQTKNDLDAALYREGRAMITAGKSEGAQKRMKAYLKML